MPYSQGYQRLNHICDCCEIKVYDVWQDRNGGYWFPACHTVKDCLSELLRRIKELEASKNE